MDALLEAAAEGDAARLRALLADGKFSPAEVSAALALAAGGGHAEAALVLLAAGAAARAMGAAPLRAAAAAGHTDVMQVLLDHDPTLDVDGAAAAAARAGRRRALRVLLKGAPAAADAALVAAAAAGSLAGVEVALEFGAREPGALCIAVKNHANERDCTPVVTALLDSGITGYLARALEIALARREGAPLAAALLRRMDPDAGAADAAATPWPALGRALAAAARAGTAGALLPYGARLVASAAPRDLPAVARAAADAGDWALAAAALGRISRSESGDGIARVAAETRHPALIRLAIDA